MPLLPKEHVQNAFNICAIICNCSVVFCVNDSKTAKQIDEIVAQKQQQQQHYAYQ